MVISARSRYALRVMVELAEQENQVYTPLRDIAARQEISEKYLESILAELVRAGLLEGTRGKGGGYRLSRPADQYTVGSILRITEGSLAPVACLDDRRACCSRVDRCRTYPMWQKLDHMIETFFDSISLSDLMRTENDPPRI